MSKSDKETIEAASDNDVNHIVTLDHPIKRGQEEIKTITVSKPFGAHLRGLSLAKLVNEADYDQFSALIPRVTMPNITKADIDNGDLHPSDFLQLSQEITGFFIPSRMRD